MQQPQIQRSSSQVISLIVFATILVAFTVPSAQANLMHKKKFVFGAFITSHRPMNCDDKDDPCDPVTVLWAGGRENTGGDCEGIFAKSWECVRKHYKDLWQAGSMAHHACNGAQDDWLRSSVEGGGSLAYAHENDELSTGGRVCSEQQYPHWGAPSFEQYHVRIWGDEPHGHRDGSHQWAVAPIHHEHCTRPPFFTNHWNCGHVPDQSWETVEAKTVYEMGAGDGSSKNRCTYPHYHALPGSGINFQGQASDGWISRISFQTTANCHNG